MVQTRRQAAQAPITAKEKTKSTNRPAKVTSTDKPTKASPRSAKAKEAHVKGKKNPTSTLASQRDSTSPAHKSTAKTRKRRSPKSPEKQQNVDSSLDLQDKEEHHISDNAGHAQSGEQGIDPGADGAPINEGDTTAFGDGANRSKEGNVQQQQHENPTFNNLRPSSSDKGSQVPPTGDGHGCSFPGSARGGGGCCIFCGCGCQGTQGTTVSDGRSLKPTTGKNGHGKPCNVEFAGDNGDTNNPSFDLHDLNDLIRLANAAMEYIDSERRGEQDVEQGEDLLEARHRKLQKLVRDSRFASLKSQFEAEGARPPEQDSSQRSPTPQQRLPSVPAHSPKDVERRLGVHTQHYEMDMDETGPVTQAMSDEIEGDRHGIRVPRMIRRYGGEKSQVEPYFYLPHAAYTGNALDRGIDASFDFNSSLLSAPNPQSRTSLGAHDSKSVSNPSRPGSQQSTGSASPGHGFRAKKSRDGRSSSGGPSGTIGDPASSLLGRLPTAPITRLRSQSPASRQNPISSDSRQPGMEDRPPPRIPVISVPPMPGIQPYRDTPAAQQRLNYYPHLPQLPGWRELTQLERDRAYDMVRHGSQLEVILRSKLNTCIRTALQQRQRLGNDAPVYPPWETKALAEQNASRQRPSSPARADRSRSRPRPSPSSALGKSKSPEVTPRKRSADEATTGATGVARKRHQAYVEDAKEESQRSTRSRSKRSKSPILESAEGGVKRRRRTARNEASGLLRRSPTSPTPPSSPEVDGYDDLMPAFQMDPDLQEDWRADGDEPLVRADLEEMDCSVDGSGSDLEGSEDVDQNASGSGSTASYTSSESESESESFSEAVEQGELPSPPAERASRSRKMLGWGFLTRS